MKLTEKDIIEMVKDLDPVVKGAFLDVYASWVMAHSNPNIDYSGMLEKDVPLIAHQIIIKLNENVKLLREDIERLKNGEVPK
jgi:hypothetical protein